MSKRLIYIRIPCTTSRDRLTDPDLQNKSLFTNEDKFNPNNLLEHDISLLTVLNARFNLLHFNLQCLADITLTPPPELIFRTHYIRYTLIFKYGDIGTDESDVRVATIVTEFASSRVEDAHIYPKNIIMIKWHPQRLNHIIQLTANNEPISTMGYITLIQKYLPPFGIVAVLDHVGA